MNKFLLCAVFSSIAFSLFSQDLITKVTGEEISANVIEVGETEIQFKKFNNPDGPTYIMNRDDILMIRYENGTKDVINEIAEATQSILVETTDGEKLYLRGSADALRYYRGYKPAATGTLVSGLVFLPAGLVPAIITSAVPPKEENLNYPSIELMQNVDYYNGYTQRARSMKQAKVWTNLGIAFGVNLVGFILLGVAR